MKSREIEMELSEASSSKLFHQTHLLITVITLFLVHSIPHCFLLVHFLIRRPSSRFSALAFATLRRRLNRTQCLEVAIHPMRLINSKNYKLVEFMGDDNIPPYAILSHTWGEGEVALKDMKYLTVRLKARYKRSSTVVVGLRRRILIGYGLIGMS